MNASTVPMPRSGAEPDLATQLRAELDLSFARPAVHDQAERLDVLTFAIGQDLYALRLTEIAEVAVRPVITKTPSSARTFLGLTATRGRVLAAYDLGALLGGMPAPASWLVVCAAEQSVGLTFERFVGYRQIQPTASDVTVIAVAALLVMVHELNSAAPQPDPNVNHDQHDRPGEQA